jgi:hypothetical protein
MEQQVIAKYNYFYETFREARRFGACQLRHDATKKCFSSRERKRQQGELP